MMPSPPSTSPSPPSPPPTYTGPSDLIAPPSPDDPDFCLKEFGRMQITGGIRSPQCMPGQNSVTPPGDSQNQQQPVPLSGSSDQPKLPTDSQQQQLVPLSTAPQTPQSLTSPQATDQPPQLSSDQTPPDQTPADVLSQQQQPQPQPAPTPPPPPDQSPANQPRLASSSEDGDSDLIPDSIKNNICFKVACGAVLGLVDSVLPDRKSLPPFLSEGPLAPKADTTVETTRGGTEMFASAGQIAAGLLAIGKGLGIGSAGVGGIAAGGTATAGAVVASPALVVLGVGLVTWGALSWLQGKQTRDDAMQMASTPRDTLDQLTGQGKITGDPADINSLKDRLGSPNQHTRLGAEAELREIQRQIVEGNTPNIKGPGAYGQGRAGPDFQGVEVKGRTVPFTDENNAQNWINNRIKAGNTQLKEQGAPGQVRIDLGDFTDIQGKPITPDIAKGFVDEALSKGNRGTHVTEVVITDKDGNIIYRGK